MEWDRRLGSCTLGLAVQEITGNLSFCFPVLLEITMPTIHEVRRLTLLSQTAAACSGATGDSDTDTAGRCKNADIICTTAEKLGENGLRNPVPVKPGQLSLLRRPQLTPTHF